MKDRDLGAGETIVADRAHARHTARWRRQHRVGADAAHCVAHQEFGVAALAAGEARREHVLPIADLIVDARRRDVTQRPGRTYRHAGWRSVAHIAFGDPPIDRIGGDACISTAHCAKQAIDASVTIPCYHPAFAIFRERAGWTYRDAFRIAALAAHRQFESEIRGHDLDTRTRDIVRASLCQCAGTHAFQAAVAFGGVESDCGVGLSHDHFHKRDMNWRPVVSGSATSRSSASERSTRRSINCRMTPPSKNSLTPKIPCSRPSLTTTLK